MSKKTPPKGEGSQRRMKAPRLELLAAAAAAEAAPVVSDPMEGNGDSSQCDHRLTDSAHKNLVLSLLSVDAGKCVGCQLEDKMDPVKRRPLESTILMCLQCSQHFCCGVGGIDYPFGHSRAHALKNQHWVGALYDDAARGYCFKCNAEVELPVELELASGVSLRQEETGVNKLCDHVPDHRVDREMLSLSSEKCDYCGHVDVTSKIVVCMECGWQICAGHALGHAKKKQHWFSVLFENPKVGFCFKCEAEVDVDSGRIQTEGRASGFGMVTGPTRDFGSVVPVVMGDARPRAGEAHESLWGAKAPWPYLPGTVVVKPTVVDPHSDPDQCNHVPSGSVHKEILSSSLLLDDAGKKCEGCQSKDRPVGNRILVCLECGRQSCGDDSGSYIPHGHAQDHAKQKQHWVAVLFDDPNTGFCFKCDIGVVHELHPDPEEEQMSDAIQSGGNVFGSDVLPNPVSVNLKDTYYHNVFGSANVQGYAIKGIPNRLNTCYVSAIVQCLLVLDKLQARMLGPDPPPGNLGQALKKLFVDASAAHAVGGTLNPDKLLESLRLHADQFKGNMMQDSYELLNSLYDALHNEENGIGTTYQKTGAPTVIDSIFRGELSVTRSCLCCQSSSVIYDPFYELSLALPSASPQTSKSLKSQPKKDAAQLLPENDSNSKIEAVAKSIDLHLGSELKDVAVEKTPAPLEVGEFYSAEAQCIWQSKDVIQDALETQKGIFASLELPEGIIEVPLNSVSSVPRNISDVKVEQTIGTTDSHCPEDFTVKFTQEDKDKEVGDSKYVPSIEDCLLLFFNGDTVELSCGCSKVPEEPSTYQSENSNLMVANTNNETVVDGGQTERSYRTTCPNEQGSDLNSLSVECKYSSSSEQDSSDAESGIIQAMDTNADRTDSNMSCGDKEYECHDGIQAVSSFRPAEKQTNPLRAQHSQILTTPNQDRRNQLVPDLSANQLGDNQHEEKRSDRATRIPQITKLPPVLTLHLKRYIQDGKKLHKNEAHVSYKEYLDVGPFMDSRYVKDNSLYRLAGVVEHQGTGSLNSGHYVAYVRARKLGNQQQQSRCSSSWFCADDHIISQVTLDEVLEHQAYILFYERMEG
ncbi:hypothetical protein U9M48_038147 [Paspalum notatum var. saurae]|uniref:Ubiquitinyl hydrolase 1 n=1 Tax=Paspalum notatum var. saurae TaxID=547442 RepID=A0AAQ3XBT8_PASNO